MLRIYQPSEIKTIKVDQQIRRKQILPWSWGANLQNDAHKYIQRIVREAKVENSEELKDQAIILGVWFKVSCDWSISKGFLALIYGAARMSREFLTIPPYKQPKCLLSTQDYTDNASDNTLREEKAGHDVLWRDWVVVCGFIGGFRENFRDTMDKKLYQDLEHANFWYDNVRPGQYFGKVSTHCPLSVQVIKDTKEHKRGWNYDSKTNPKTIKWFEKRLTQEQEALERERVKIADTEKKQYYLLRKKRSRVFPTDVIHTFKSLDPEDQKWDQATIFFENKIIEQEEIERLVGDTSEEDAYSNVNAALE